MERNEPLLADVRAPWDVGWRARDVIKPRNLWRMIAYNRRYKGFWAPSSMEAWRYRRLLRNLDEVCLRGLKSHGALTARELADWLNREGLHTKPELTGIHRITTATVHGWLQLASRRGLVGEWVCRHATGRDPHWELSEQGRKDLHPKFLVALRAETIDFRKPVAYVNGDSHYFRVDKPLLDSAGKRVVNFTRVETFGDNQPNLGDVNWLKVNVDPSSREVFSYEPQIVNRDSILVP